MQEQDRGFLFMENTLNEFQKYLVEEKELARATVLKYRTDMNTFQHFLKEDRWVSKERLMQYKEWLAERYAPASANSMLAALNQYLEFTGHEKMKVKRLKVQTQLFVEQEKELTVQEYRRLLAAARKMKKGSLELLLESICATGIRVSELFYLTAEGVRKGKIKVNNKGKIRMVFLPEELRKKLLYFIQKEGISRGPVFVTKNGRPKDRSNIWREMKQLADASGVEASKIFPHNLRHLFARTFYRMTGDLIGLADILGHSSLSVTRIYTKESGERFRKQIERMALVQPQKNTT